MQKPLKKQKQPPGTAPEAFELAAHILFATFGKGGVVFNLHTRESLRLNPTGASVVELLDGRHSTGDIIQRLSEENRMTAGDIKSDIEHFLKDIKNRGWVVGC